MRVREALEVIEVGASVNRSGSGALRQDGGGSRTFLGRDYGGREGKEIVIGVMVPCGVSWTGL
jgi:hypothetical protein